MRAANLGLRPMYTGVAESMAAFKFLRDAPYYSVWIGRDMLTQYSGNDLEEGERRLQDILEAADQQGDTSIFVIKFHPELKKNWVTNDSPITGTLPIRACALDDGGSISGLTDSQGTLPNSVYYLLKDVREAANVMKEGNAKIEQRLLALESGDVAKEVDMFDRIGAIIEKPGVMDFLGKLVSMLPIGQPQQPNIQVAGVGDEPKSAAAADVVDPVIDTPLELSNEENDRIDTAIMRLSVHCNIVDAMEIMANWADKNPEMFKGTLASLKNL